MVPRVVIPGACPSPAMSPVCSIETSGSDLVCPSGGGAESVAAPSFKSPQSECHCQPRDDCDEREVSDAIIDDGAFDGWVPSLAELLGVPPLQASGVVPAQDCPSEDSTSAPEGGLDPDSDLEAKVQQESKEGDVLWQEHLKALRWGCCGGLFGPCLCLTGSFGACLDRGGPEHVRTGKAVGFAAGMCFTGVLMSFCGFILCMFNFSSEGDGGPVLPFVGLVLYLVGLTCAHTAHRRWLVASQRWDHICPPPRGALPGCKVEALRGVPRSLCGCLPVRKRKRTDFASPFPRFRPPRLPSCVTQEMYSNMALKVNDIRLRTQWHMDWAPLYCSVFFFCMMLAFAAELESRRSECTVFKGRCLASWLGASFAPSIFITLVLWKLFYYFLRALSLRRVGRFLQEDAQQSGLARHNLRWVIRNPSYARCHTPPVLWLVLIDTHGRSIEKLGVRWQEAFSSLCGPMFRAQVKIMLWCAKKRRGTPSEISEDLLLSILSFLPKGGMYRPYPTLTDRLGV
eukprot:Hpha_TRINITY_DN16226_c2_g5::TRINITY_DN16226_c2_g5_i1::g.15111::m.15111